ncbi:ribonuclease III [Desulfonatronovibrio magnus]|uniref:ribonuclease III n=1 Tax=Desulfonatronovibrio magnus TaxID=698827 RepID=UPI000AFA4C92
MIINSTQHEAIFTVIMENQELIQKKIGYYFKHKDLLSQALTHSSYANEHGIEHNERLEFLGDAVLELCISRILFYSFPEASEGHLTKLRAGLVSEPSLARIARTLSLGDYILLGKGEDHQGGRERDSVLSDTLEAVLGAVYLDSGYETAHECIKKIFMNFIPDSVESLPSCKDYKSRLQEATQSLFKARPVYALMESSGPEHEKTYRVRVELPNGVYVDASASSVKKAEQKAAGKAIQELSRASA